MSMPTQSKLVPILVLQWICTGWFLAVLAQPSPPSGIYLEDLRVWLKSNWYDGYHDQLGYNEGRRQMYGYTDILSNGNVECIYTGFQQPGGFVTYPNPINAEHIVPQSFFGSAEPMRSDIYILRPCHGSANSSRSNDPYGEVNDNQAQWYGVNGNSYTSTSNEPANSDDWSEGTGSMWEPRESKKGDVARAVFYYYTMYPDEGTNISACGDLATLYDWHVNDPPDAAEISRNTKINLAQGNKNPYVDNPDLVYLAWLYDGTLPNDDTEGPDFTGTASSLNVACGSTPGVLADPTDPCGLRRSHMKTSSMEPMAALEVQALSAPTPPRTVAATSAHSSRPWCLSTRRRLCLILCLPMSPSHVMKETSHLTMRSPLMNAQRCL